MFSNIYFAMLIFFMIFNLIFFSAIPGQYPTRMNYRPPPYQAYNTVYPQPYTTPNAGGTTVVVQGDRPAGYGGGDFAMGMLVGGALGTAWGSSLHGHGYGYGFGHGWGGGHGPQIHDTDITINNYYDNDTSVVNNNLDMTNNVTIEQEEPDSGEVIMGDIMPLEEGGGMFDGGDFDCGDFGDF